MPTRNCGRCFLDFETDNPQGRVCAACRRPSHSKPISNELTKRERQIAALVAAGESNKAIAYKLHLREGTVKEYSTRIVHKLGIPNRAALGAWAVRTGLIE